MAAVVYRLRAMLHHRRRASTVGLVMLVAIVGAAVAALAAGSVRTASAPDRYSARYGGGFSVQITQDRGGAPRTGDVAPLPAVDHVVAITFVLGGAIPVGSDGPADALVFAGNYQAGSSHLVRGRDTDPSDEHEAVVTQSFLDETGVALGAEMDVVTYTEEQRAANQYGVAPPMGPTIRTTIVGIVAGSASELDDPTPLVLLSPAVLAIPEVGFSQTIMRVALRPGADLAALRTQLDGLPDPNTLSAASEQYVTASVRVGVDAQSRGLWILTGVAGLAALVVAGQILTRQVQLSSVDRDRLVAIGMTDGQIVAESVGRASIPIVIGSLLGGCLAVLPSAIFPVGFVRMLEPTPGLHVDVPTLAAAVGASAVGLVLWTACSLALAHRRPRHRRPSALLESVATRAVTPTAATGLRFAFARREREQGSPRAALAGLLLVVGGIFGAVVFGVSLGRLVDEPARYGANFDVAGGDNGGTALPDGLADALEASPDIATLTLYGSDYGRIGSITVQLVAMQGVRGDGAPHLTQGRLPAADDEVAFGRVTANDVGAHVGDTTTITGPTGTKTYRVTGIAVLPGFGANDGMGSGALMTLPALRAINDAAQFNVAAVDLVSHAPALLARVAPLFGVEPGTPLPTLEFRPGSIDNVARVRGIPFVLATVLGALAVLTVVHVMLTSLRGQLRDIAVLRALGAERAWITRALHWQATVFTLCALCIGIPLGMVAGRLVFRLFADSMGAVDDPSTPFLFATVAIVSVLVVANTAAAVPARRARRSNPADVLLTE